MLELFVIFGMTSITLLTEGNNGVEKELVTLFVGVGVTGGIVIVFAPVIISLIHAAPETERYPCVQALHGLT